MKEVTQDVTYPKDRFQKFRRCLPDSGFWNPQPNAQSCKYSVFVPSIFQIMSGGNDWTAAILNCRQTFQVYLC